MPLIMSTEIIPLLHAGNMLKVRCMTFHTYTEFLGFGCRLNMNHTSKLSTYTVQVPGKALT